MDNKKKIINDPVFGFITVPTDFLYQLIQHPILQRLQRIKQLGMASFVYPGAQHTRFHHSLGALYLMHEAIVNLRFKGNEISEDEANGALACILLHDIGHGPFSHVLEYTLTEGISHEVFSLSLMKRLNQEFDGKLDLCIKIFEDKYHKKFLHQLVSGQLDVDRLDYLRRDSYFTGVVEGNIGSARIIKMMDVRNDQLVIEAKGIYSIENFLTSRRLMYWQVYLHKTAVASEKLLQKILDRAKYLSTNGVKLFATPALSFFLNNQINKSYFETDSNQVLDYFTLLDDNDIWSSIKVWMNSTEDIILSKLCQAIISRQIFKIEITTTPTDSARIEEYKLDCATRLGINEKDTNYFFSTGTINSKMYTTLDDKISILYKDNSTKDISEASDMLNIQLLSRNIEKYFFAYYKL